MANTQNSEGGKVQIKLAFAAVLKPKTCTIINAESGEVLWKGAAGSLAEFLSDGKTHIRIHYASDESSVAAIDLDTEVEANKEYELKRQSSSVARDLLIAGAAPGTYQISESLQIHEVRKNDT